MTTAIKKVRGKPFLLVLIALLLLPVGLHRMRNDGGSAGPPEFEAPPFSLMLEKDGSPELCDDGTHVIVPRDISVDIPWYNMETGDQYADESELIAAFHGESGDTIRARPDPQALCRLYPEDRVRVEYPALKRQIEAVRRRMAPQ